MNNNLNLNEDLKVFFEKFPNLQDNFCEKCLNLEENELNVYLMDTGICDKCGKTADVVNPLIYSFAKLTQEKVDVFNFKFKRIYRKEDF